MIRRPRPHALVFWTAAAYVVTWLVSRTLAEVLAVGWAISLMIAAVVVRGDDELDGITDHQRTRRALDGTRAEQ